MAAESCRNCKFLQQDATYPAVLRCRRYPPVMAGGVYTPPEYPTFPLVIADWWCGEWQSIPQIRES